LGHVQSGSKYRVGRALRELASLLRSTTRSLKPPEAANLNRNPQRGTRASVLFIKDRPVCIMVASELGTPASTGAQNNLTMLLPGTSAALHPDDGQVSVMIPGTSGHGFSRSKRRSVVTSQASSACRVADYPCPFRHHDCTIHPRRSQRTRAMRRSATPCLRDSGPQTPGHSASFDRRY